MMKSALLQRDPGFPPIQAWSGDGSWINGAFFDLSSGAGVACLGLGRPDIARAMVEWSRELGYAHAAQCYTASAELLAADLLSNLGPAFADGGVTFFSGGAEAVEAACKLATQYLHLTMSGIGRVRYVGRRYSYHGASLFTLALGDHPRKRAVANEIAGIDVGRFLAYAPHMFTSSGDRATSRALSLDSLARQLRSGQRSVVVVEPVGGTAIGIAAPDKKYLVGLADTCREAGAVLIYDEILCGNWRTGSMFAHRSLGGDEADPDIVVTGKGLTGGYFPLSAVCLSSRLAVALRDHHLGHTSTNQNHPVGCGVANLVQSLYRQATRGGHIGALMDHLDQRVPELRKAPGVSAVTGFGLLRGIHLDPTVPGLHRVARAALRGNGVIAYTEGSTVDSTGNFILLAPPYCTTIAELDEVLDRVTKTIAELPTL